MPFTFSVEEVREARGFSLKGEVDRMDAEWTRKFRVVVSASGGDEPKDVGDYDVITASGLPVINRSIYETDTKIIPQLICRDKKAKREGRRLDRWLVTATYRTFASGTEESDINPIEFPDNLTDITPTETSELGEIRRVLYEDKKSTPEAIKLPSGAFFSEPVMDRIPTLTVKLTQYEASITYFQMLDRKFKVNSGTYRGEPRYRWLIEDVEATEVSVRLVGGLTTAALVTYTLKYLPVAEGWKRALALIDYKYFNGTKFVPNLEGDPRTASLTFVTTTGTKKADQSRPDFVEFEPFSDSDFSFLQA